MTDPTDTPAKQSAEALFMADERALIAALMAGTGALRKAGERYLPKHPAESAEAYKYRVAVSTLYNGMRRTVETLAGKPFSEPLDLGAEMPTALVEYCADIDLQGRDLHAFAHAVFTAALADGLSHILVDYPQTLEGATLADKKTTGARPYFVHIRHDQILGWRSQRIAGVETLTQLRIMECVTEPNGQWGTKTVDQVRVLEPDLWTTYRKNDKGDWVENASGAVTLGAIPLATVYTDRVAYMQARPPLLDLAHLNIEHWQSSSDQSNILHVARVPILFASGFDDDERALKIGAGSAVSNSDPASKLSYVEHSGAAIEAGRVSLKDLEERMSLMGAQLLVRKPGARTATEKAIDSADADSALSLMARNLEDSLEYALQFAADWENLGAAGEVELTGEIGGLEDMELAALMQARTLGLLSAETIFNELQRRGLLSDDMTWAEEAAKLKAEGPPLPVGTGGRYESQGDGAVTPASGIAPTTAPTAPAGVPATPAAPHPAPDFGPLIAALHAHTQAVTAPTLPFEKPEPLDLSGLVDAIRSQPAPVINVTTPAVTVEAPITVNVPEQPAAQINIAPAAITVEGPQISLPSITVDVPAAQITVAQAKPGEITFVEDAAGNITGATLS